MFSSNASQVSGSANYIEDVFSTYLYKGNGTSQEISNGINLDGRFISSNIASVRTTESYSTIYAQGKYITCSGSRILTSTDGTTWSISSSSPSGGYGFIAFNGTSEYMFVSGQNGYCYTSTDLVNWTSKGTRGSIPGGFGAINGTYVVWGYMPGTSTVAAYYSSNSGTSWTSFTDMFVSYNSYPSLVKLVNGVLFACRSGGVSVKLESSTNGTSWTDRTSGISGSYSIFDITYGNGKYVAIDYAGNYYYSTDLSSWTLVSGDGGSVGSIGFFNGYFVSAGVAATYSYKIKTSTDGATWTEIGGMPSVQSDSSNGMTCADGSAGVMFVTQAARNSLCVDPTQPVKGGLNWIKHRTSATRWHVLTDTARGLSSADGYCLSTNVTNAQFLGGSVVTGFNNSGLSLGPVVEVNQNTYTFSSWTFRKQPKFFDIITYTGNATAGRTISHSLGSVPGCIIIKRTDTADNWVVYHRGLNGGVNPEQYYAMLNLTNAGAVGTYWNNTAPTSTNFTLNGGGSNISGGTYVAYLFAHDAGGFGLTGSDNVISCGTYATNGSAAGPFVDLGWEPQFIIVKGTTAAGSYWNIIDTMRGHDSATNTGYSALFANNAGAEQASNSPIKISATGFQDFGAVNFNDNVIYIAIRRGPMKVPTDGTTVFKTTATSDSGAAATISGGPSPTDLVMYRDRAANGSSNMFLDRMRGKPHLDPTLGQTEAAYDELYWDVMNGYRTVSNYGNYAVNSVRWMFKRAPSFFDEVCYTGTGSNQTVKHNLGVTPEMMIIKSRNYAGCDWIVYHSGLGNTQAIYLNLTSASGVSASYFNNTSPTSTQFTVSTNDYVNANSKNHVAYLFATCAGVSKVGSYTGTGTTKQINCGFTTGARFVMIKRTDSTGAWYIWDSVRGIISGDDPYLFINTQAGEVTNTDYIDPYSSGFEISSTAPAAINASGGTYIFLAIA